MKTTELYAQKWKILGKFCVMCVLPQKLEGRRWDFPGSLVVKTLHLQCAGCGCGGRWGGPGAWSIPAQETKVPIRLMAQSRKKERKKEKYYVKIHK